MRLVIYVGFFLAVIPSVFALSPGSQNQPIVPPIFAITSTDAVDGWKLEGTMSPNMSYTVYTGSQSSAPTRVKCSEDEKADANGHFVCTFKSQPKETFVELRAGDGKTPLAQSVFPQHDSSAASPASGGTTTFFLDINMNYCDRSLPYLFTQRGTLPKLEIMTSSTWKSWLETRMKDGLGQTPAVDVVWDADALPANWKNSNVNDPIGSDAVVADAGGPILGDPSNEISTNTADAQRLLIRTLFGPNAFHLACQYQYLTGEPPAPSDTTLANADGTKESGLTNGIGKPFDLAAVDAPHYYLIDIVRWTDAPATKSSPVLLYQVASDDWYLLNYSNKLDANRDLTTLGRFKPQMVQKIDGASQALNIVGDQNVLFLAIHLAPQPTQPKTATSSDPNVSYPPFNGFQISPTERAWYSTKIRYTMKAAHVQPLNVQDLSTLIQALLGFTTSSKNSAPVAQGQETANFAPPPNRTLSLEEQITNLQGSFKLSPIDLILRGKRADCGQMASNLLEAIEDTKDTQSVTVDSVKDLAENVKNECGVTIKFPENGTPEEIQSAIISGLQAGVPSKEPIYSLYQGQYGAALVTNMSNLPVDLSSTWTATFSPAPPAVTVASNAYVLSSPIKSTALSKVPSKSSKAQDAGGGNRPLSSGPSSDAANQQVNGGGTSAVCDATIDSSNDALGDDVPPTQKPCTSPSATIVHNEKLSYWDISVAAPLPGYQDLTYEAGTTSTGTGTITAKTITRTNAYAMFDWFPFGQDLNTPPTIGIPHLAGGLPLAGKTFNKPYFAVAETFRIPKIPILGTSVSLRPMFGWVWNKEFHMLAATSATPSSKTPYRALKPQFAIEVSIKSVASAISKSTSK